jgi:hypothetical protein
LTDGLASLAVYAVTDASKPSISFWIGSFAPLAFHAVNDTIRQPFQIHLIKITQSFKKGLINILRRYLNTIKTYQWLEHKFEPAN